MLYTKRTVRCSARGLSREDAKLSLVNQFEGTELLDIKRRGDKWVATLLEPKQAEFPPSKDEDDSEESGPPQEDTSDEPSPPKEDGGDSDGPPKGDKGPPKEKGGEKVELSALLDLVSQIADKLGIVPGGAVPGAEDPMAAGPPVPPPPGPPHSDPGVGGEGHQEIVHRTKLKPGDTPPGVTPIGSPAFASLSRMASFDAFDDTPGKSIKQAKDELEALYGPHGFTVRQIKRVEGGKRLAAKLSRR